MSSTTNLGPLGGILSQPTTEEEIAASQASIDRLRQQFLSSQQTEQERQQQEAQQKVYYEAFQNVNQQLQQSGGGTITTEAINEEYNKLVETKYSEGVQVTDQEAQAAYINQQYEIFKSQYSPGSTSSSDYYEGTNIKKFPESTGNPVIDAASALGAYGRNIVNQILYPPIAFGLGGGEKRVNVPDLILGQPGKRNILVKSSEIFEAEIESDVISLATAEDRSKSLAAIQANILSNPGYAAGSIAGSALTFFGPQAVGKVLKVPRAIKVVSSAGRVTEAAVQSGKEAGLQIVAARPVKITKAGDIVPQREGPAGFVYEQKQVPAIGTRNIAEIEIPGTYNVIGVPGLTMEKRTIDKLTTPRYYTIEGKEAGSEAGIIDLVSGKAYIYPAGGEILSIESKAAKVGEKLTPPYFKDRPPLIESLPVDPSKTRASETIDIFRTPKEALAVGQKLRRDAASGKYLRGEDIFLAPAEQLEGKLAGPAARVLMGDIGTRPKKVPLGTVIGYRTKDLLKTSTAIAKRDADEAAKVASRRPSSPLIFPKAKGGSLKFKATSNQPLKAVEIHRSDAELQKYRKLIVDVGRDQSGDIARAGAGIIAGTKALGLGGGASVYGSGKESLGFGGATGAERVGRRRIKLNLDTSWLRTPPGYDSKAKVKSDTSSRLSNVPGQGTGQSSENLSILGTGQLVSQAQRQSPAERLDQGSKSDLANLLGTVEITTPISDTTTGLKQDLITETVPVPEVPTIPVPGTRLRLGTIFDPLQDRRRRRRKDYGIMGDTGLKHFAAKNPFATKFSITKGGKFAKGLNVLAASRLTGGKKGRKRKVSKVS